MSKNTPGPWRVEESADVGFDIRGGMDELVVGSEGVRTVEDARLIAAAPELLRDLIDACEWLDSILLGDRPKAALADYRRTIAKAEGKQ